MNYEQFNNAMDNLCFEFRKYFKDKSRIVKCYPIPKGGVPVGLVLAQRQRQILLVDDPKDADFFVDDIIDSGSTRERFRAAYQNRPFIALVDKLGDDREYQSEFFEFPWEAGSDGGIHDNISRLLQYVGEDPTRGGLKETPDRVAKAWKFWCKGYREDPVEILKVFEDGAENYDQMITVRDIPIYSHCEHHLAPIFGTATISYIPKGKIVGLSKLSRLADIFARRLQVQERLTNQIADALWKGLEPTGVGVMVKARHLCMESRGVCQQGHSTITTALRGCILDESRTRAEFLRMCE